MSNKTSRKLSDKNAGNFSIPPFFYANERMIRRPASSLPPQAPTEKHRNVPGCGKSPYANFSKQGLVLSAGFLYTCVF
jgi:hypothetical protein